MGGALGEFDRDAGGDGGRSGGSGAARGPKIYNGTKKEFNYLE